jgi:hypothetical protein
VTEETSAHWRRLSLSQRASIVERIGQGLIREAEGICRLWADCYALPEQELWRYELVGLVAALEELASVARGELEPTRVRRWLGAERTHSRIEAPERWALVVEAGTLPAAPLARCAAACLAGSEVALGCHEDDRRAYEAVLSRSWDERASLPISLAPSAAQELSGEVERLGGLERGAVLRRLPALCWLDDVRDADELCARLIRAARYAGGRRATLVWVSGPPAAIDALFAPRSPWRSAVGGQARIDGVEVSRGVYDRPTLESAVTTARGLCVSSFEHAREWVEHARGLGPWSVCCAFGRDIARVRSLAARTGAEALMVNCTPADALGGLMRVEFDAHRTLRSAVREVPVAYGPAGRVANVHERSERWLRAWVRLCFGRYGVGGRVDDLW